jgi:pyroglutamyl-peptidase
VSARVLLTSFEPFGGLDLNSSLEVGKAVRADPPAGVELHWHTLPVVAGKCVETAWALVEKLCPALVVALGQAAGAAAIRVEDRAVNLDDFPIPDNAGNWRRLQWVVPGAPGAYLTAARADLLVADLVRARIPAERSYSAGRYVCNHLYYGLLHRAAVAGLSHQTLFLHLPLLLQQVPNGVAFPAQPLPVLVEGVRRAIRVCLPPDCG